MANGECLMQLARLGMTDSDAMALRRVAMTLHRWFELECGDGNEHGSWAIERDDNGDGPPFLVHHHYQHGRGKDYTSRTRIADREKGARKRLGKVLARYPGLVAYIQGDPRGASLYVLKAEDVAGREINQVYSTCGVAVYK